MCGRSYSTYTDEELFIRYLNRRRVQLPGFAPNYNFSPTQTGPVVRVVDGARTITPMRWGLVPPWEPEFKTKLSTINAKSETVFQSRLYKPAITKRRCIVPLSGFIEWMRSESGGKRPFCIRLKDQPIMSVAGIWESWGPTGEQLSFSILTTTPNTLMGKIHDRMPVILAEKDEEAWLDPANQDEKRISDLMQPCPDSWLQAFEVSPAINSPKNNALELLKPLTGEVMEA